jgi:hypothetical protein
MQNGNDLARHAPRDGNEVLPVTDRAVDDDQVAIEKAGGALVAQADAVGTGAAFVSTCAYLAVLAVAADSATLERPDRLRKPHPARVIVNVVLITPDIVLTPMMVSAPSDERLSTVYFWLVLGQLAVLVATGVAFIRWQHVGMSNLKRGGSRD